MSLFLLLSALGCSSTNIIYSPVGPHQRVASLLVFHEHGLFHLGSCGFSQNGETFHIALLGEHKVYTKEFLELKMNDEAISSFDGRVELLSTNRVLIDLYVTTADGRRRALPVNGVRHHE